MKLHEFFSCKELHTRRAVGVHLCMCSAEWNAFWINEVNARAITPLRNKKAGASCSGSHYWLPTGIDSR